jgi:hypothetical protein
MRSPNEKERALYGYSPAWLHHKGRNKHHFEYWNDYDPVSKRVKPVKMPARYLAEMVCDRMAASKTYMKEDYSDSAPLEYFLKSAVRKKDVMHPETAAKLTELSHLPGKTKEVGETAGREIYISWEDAVANAYGRYEVVIDRYRSGYYKTRLPYDYDFFRAQGELMETLGNIDAARHSIIKDAEELRGDMDRKARSIRNKALTDIITAGYETRQELKSMKNDAEQLIQSKKEAALESIGSVRKEFWETLDRYL